MAKELKTKDDVFSLPVPAKGETVYFDRGPARIRAPGLALRVRAAGSRRWAFYYRFVGVQKRLMLGDASALTLAAARDMARAHRVTLDTGKDPALEKAVNLAAHALTVSAVAEKYLEAVKGDLRPRSLDEVKRHLLSIWKPIHQLPIASVELPTVADCLRKIKNDNGPVAANRARASLSGMFGWAIAEGYCKLNPVTGTNQNKEQARERVLTDDEIARIWKSCGDDDYGHIVKLLLLTGQRRQEIGALRWSEVQDDTIALPKERTKNDRPHDVPLSAAAMAIISEARQGQREGGQDSDLCFGRGKNGFNNWSEAKAALDARSAVTGWRLHDLRRTCVTGMNDLKIKPHIVEVVVNHASGFRAGVSGTYNKAAYADEKREALDRWAQHVLVLLAQADGTNVVSMKKV